MSNYIDKWFHFYETTAIFEAHLEKGFIDPDSICFLKESGQIFTQNTYFGLCRAEFDELVRLVSKHESMLNDILGIEGPSVDDGIINNLKEITDFLTGFENEENLKEILEALQKALQAEIGGITGSFESRFAELAGKMDNLTRALYEQVTSLEAKIDSKVSNIDSLIVRQDALESSINTHLNEWEIFKSSYMTFRDYVDSTLHSLDDSFHALQESLTVFHQELESISIKVNSFDTKVAELVEQIHSCHILVDRLENKFDALTEEVYDFFNSKGHPDGLAPLDSNGKVPSEHLPSYVDDVLEFADSSRFPEEGETGKIYVSLDDNLTYRWSGTQYVEISKSLALGETSSTAYSGDKGKQTTDNLNEHLVDFDNPHRVDKDQVGLGNVDNTSDLNKPVSNQQRAEFDRVDAEIVSTETALAAHIDDKDNPHEVTKAQIGLDNVDNTSDEDKPISTAQQEALDNKVDKEEGKGLSANDFTDELKDKLENLGDSPDYSEDITNINQNITNIQSDLDSKVDKEEGKGLSSNDFTDALKDKLESLSTVTPDGSYDDTEIKASITAINTEVNNKVDKEEGKGLSSNDFTDTLKEKLENLHQPVLEVILDTNQYNTLINTEDGLINAGEFTVSVDIPRTEYTELYDEIKFMRIYSSDGRDSIFNIVFAKPSTGVFCCYNFNKLNNEKIGIGYATCSYTNETTLKVVALRSTMYMDGKTNSIDDIVSRLVNLEEAEESINDHINDTTIHIPSTPSGGGEKVLTLEDGVPVWSLATEVISVEGLKIGTDTRELPVTEIGFANSDFGIYYDEYGKIGTVYAKSKTSTANKIAVYDRSGLSVGSISTRLDVSDGLGFNNTTLSLVTGIGLNLSGGALNLDTSTVQSMADSSTESVTLKSKVNTHISNQYLHLPNEAGTNTGDILVLGDDGPHFMPFKINDKTVHNNLITLGTAITVDYDGENPHMYVGVGDGLTVDDNNILAVKYVAGMGLLLDSSNSLCLETSVVKRMAGSSAGSSSTSSSLQVIDWGNGSTYTPTKLKLDTRFEIYNDTLAGTLDIALPTISVYRGDNKKGHIYDNLYIGTGLNYSDSMLYLNPGEGLTFDYTKNTIKVDTSYLDDRYNVNLGTNGGIISNGGYLQLDTSIVQSMAGSSGGGSGICLIGTDGSSFDSANGIVFNDDFFTISQDSSYSDYAYLTINDEYIRSVAGRVLLYNGMTYGSYGTIALDTSTFDCTYQSNGGVWLISGKNSGTGDGSSDYISGINVSSYSDQTGIDFDDQSYLYATQAQPWQVGTVTLRVDTNALFEACYLYFKNKGYKFN